MSSVSAVNNAALDLTKKQTTSEAGGANLDKNAFLKLLSAQMKYQDPMNPTDQTQQLAQLANFSSLEQMSNMAASMAAMGNEAKANTAVNLVGKDVTYKNDKGESVTGKVEKVTFKDGAPMLVVGGVADIDPAKISEVA